MSLRSIAGSLVRRATEARGKRSTALPTLEVVPTLPTLPTLDDHGNIVADDDRPTNGSSAEADPACPTTPSPEAFLAREARLLDERRWDDWLGLWLPGGRYSMPTRRTTTCHGSERPVSAELVPDMGVWWFDDGVEQIAMRIAKLKTGKAWAEEPPSRTRRFVSNIEVELRPDGGYLVRSNLLIYRGRRDCDVEWFSCGRADVLRPADDGALRFERREVTIDANVIAADNLMLFF